MGEPHGILERFGPRALPAAWALWGLGLLLAAYVWQRDLRHARDTSRRERDLRLLPVLERIEEELRSLETASAEYVERLEARLESGELDGAAMARARAVGQGRVHLGIVTDDAPGVWQGDPLPPGLERWRSTLALWRRRMISSTSPPARDPLATRATPLAAPVSGYLAHLIPGPDENWLHVFLDARGLVGERLRDLQARAPGGGELALALRTNEDSWPEGVPLARFREQLAAPGTPVTWPVVWTAMHTGWGVPLLQVVARPASGLELSALESAHRAGLGLLLLFFATTGLTFLLLHLHLRQAQEVARSHQRFTALVSHELRTPLASLSMYSEILHRGLVPDAGKIQEYYTILHRESRRLDRQVANLLEVARLERRLVPMKLSSQSLDQLLGEALARTCPDEEARAVLFRIERRTTADAVKVDPDALLAILGNLVDNAMKYAGAAPPIELVIEAGGDAGADLVLTLLDRGPGIPPADLARLLAPFERGRDPSQPGGLGLGLFLVARLAELQSLGFRLEARDPTGLAARIIFPDAARVTSVTAREEDRR